MRPEIKELIRPNILALKPYSSARDEFKGEAKVYLDANESPYGEYNRYPDPKQNSLRMRLASIKDIKVENLLLGNGSDECIDLLFRIFCTPGSDRALTFTPTYGMYEVSAAINNVDLIELPLNDEFQIDLEQLEPYLSDTRIKLIFICSPNNPTGNLLSPDLIRTVLDQFKGIVVIDEAYIDFAESTSWSKQIMDYPNLVVLQTMSKAYGMANLRIGMTISSEDIIGLMNKVKPPYNLSGLVQSKALEVLQDAKAIEDNIRQTLEQRQTMVAAFSILNCVNRVFASDANFILVDMESASMRYKLLADKGIIIRSRVNVIDNCLRITIGTPEENELILREIRVLDQIQF